MSDSSPDLNASSEASGAPTPWSTLGLDPAWLEAAQALGFAQPTPIQAQALPAVLAGQDVLARAATGSGKTLAYVLPLLQSLGAHVAPDAWGRRVTQALVLVPTRDLAEQVAEAVIGLLRAHGHSAQRVVTACGGVSINPQMMALRGGAEWVIATPGRLLDLVQRRALHLHGLRSVVLDEADRLLDAGFAEELEGVMATLPAERQTLMFSATFAPRVQAAAQRLMRDAVILGAENGDAEVSTPRISQRAIAVDTAMRTPLLRHLLAQEQWPRVLVFVATRYATEHVADKLYRAGINATPFHGDMSQGARRDVLDLFKQARWQVVVTTDLAARGIDIEGLEAVVNYDLPRSASDYVHRIGRSGRAGEQGLAVSLVPPPQAAHWRLIEKRNGLQLTPEVIAGFEPTEAAPVSSHDPDHIGGIKGKRPSKKDKLRAGAAAQAKDSSET